jgi:predicted PhzF superfamily epimerase YddE/YHI9
MKFFQVNSFVDKLYAGNPAGVCLAYGDWPDETFMQRIATAADLSETAFVLAGAEGLGLRWFTPTTEVPLCGHATLAAAHVLFEHEGFANDEIVFKAGKNTLKVAYEGDLLMMDFPAAKIWQIDFIDAIDCFNYRPKEVWRSEDEYMLVFEDEEQVRGAVCNLEKAAKIDLFGLIVTAPATLPHVEFVSRYFAPKIGIDEDPVTGSAHTLLVPYWRDIMGKDEFRAVQLSKRGGSLFCRAVSSAGSNETDRVIIGGKAVTAWVGEYIYEFNRIARWI